MKRYLLRNNDVDEKFENNTLTDYIFTSIEQSLKYFLFTVYRFWAHYSAEIMWRTLTVNAFFVSVGELHFNNFTSHKGVLFFYIIYCKIYVGCVHTCDHKLKRAVFIHLQTLRPCNIVLVEYKLSYHNNSFSLNGFQSLRPKRNNTE